MFSPMKVRPSLTPPRARLEAVCLAASLLLGTTVQAQTPQAEPSAPSLRLSEAAVVSPAPSSDYEVALSEALEAHARGDYGQARIFMERAHSLDPSARTLRGLGIVAFGQGRHLEAIRFLDASLASQMKPLPPELRSGVQELLTHAWGQMGHYEIIVEPSGGDFLVDGQLPDFYAPNTVVLSPGAHVVTARAAQRADHELPLEVKPGDRRTLQIVLARPPAPRVIERFVDRPASESAGASWTKRKRRIAWTTGAALIGAGAAVYGLAYARLDDIVDRCRDMASGSCTPRGAEKLYRKENIEGLGITSGILIGGGALTWLSALALEIWSKDDEPQRAGQGPKATLQVGPSSVAVSGRF